MQTGRASQQVGQCWNSGSTRARAACAQPAQARLSKGDAAADPLRRRLVAAAIPVRLSSHAPWRTEVLLVSSRDGSGFVFPKVCGVLSYPDRTFNACTSGGFFFIQEVYF